MIIGHVNTPLRDFIFSFHMPLFFFISGYLYKDRCISDILHRCIDKILIPYLATCLFIWLVYIVAAHNWDWGLSILLANGSLPVYSFEGYAVGPLWFLMCYFVSIIGFHYVIKIKNLYIQISTLCVLWICAYIYNANYGLLPFDILCAIPSMLCLLIGYNLRHENIRKIVFSPMLTILGSCVWIICIVYGKLSMASFVYKLSILQLIGALYGTYITYSILKFFGGGCPRITDHKSEILQSVSLPDDSCLLYCNDGQLLGGETSHSSNATYNLKVENSQNEVLRRSGGGYLARIGSISLALVCIHSVDYNFKISDRTADYIFLNNYLNTIFNILAKFLIVCCGYVIIKHIPILRKIYCL